MPEPRRTPHPRLDTVLLWGCILLLGVTVLYPTLRLLLDALRLWQWDALTRGDGLEAIRNTLVLSLASVAGAGLVGTALAFVLTRYVFPGRGVLAAMAYLPFTLPPLVGVLSFYYLIGRDGFLPRCCERLFGIEGVALPGPWAILLIHTYSFYVFFYAMVEPALAGMDRSLGEAARSLGAGRLRVFFRVTLPLLAPALNGAALLTFMSSAASFSAPYFFGQDFPMLSVQVFLEQSQFNLGAALTLTVVLAAVSLMGVLLFRGARRPHGAASKGVRMPIRSAGGRAAAGVMAWGCILLLLLPHAIILWLSFIDHKAWGAEVFPSAWTFDNYAFLLSKDAAFAPFRNSLWMSGVAAVATAAVALPAAYLIARRRRGHRMLNLLVMLPWALPGTVIAMNLIAAFNDPWLPRGSLILMLPLAYFVRNVPLLTRMAAAAIEPFDATLIEAGRGLGAGPGYCFRHLVLPLLAPALIAAIVLVFAMCLGEFVASILLYTVANIPISVQISIAWRELVGTAFAYSVLLMLLVGAAFAVSRRFSSRF